MSLTDNELATAAILLQALTILLWIGERQTANFWRDRAKEAERNSLRRDPKTGRFLRNRKD